jgi:hypothetical protein
MSLAEVLLKPPKREQVVKDATDVLNAEVADKRGVTGLAVKGTFKVVRGLKPGFIPEAIDNLLDDFMKKVEPFWQAWKDEPAGKTCSQYFVARGADVADSLLSITDERAKHSRHKLLVKSYNKLRPRGRDHVIASMPRVGELIDKHTRDL